MNDRGQGTVEFIILFASALFFFVVFLGVVQMNVSAENEQKRTAFLLNVARDVRDEVGLAASSSDGYLREFYVPTKVMGSEYVISIVGLTVFCSLDDFSYSYDIVDVSGDVEKGVNVIRKENGEISLN